MPVSEVLNAPAPAASTHEADSIQAARSAWFMGMSTSGRLGDAVLMACRELKESDGFSPALMDDGASTGTSCTRSLVGAIPGTFKKSDAGQIGVGSDDAALESHGSYLFALERFGTNGSEKVLRRLKYTPNLPMAMVFSEATENKEYGYGIYWPPKEQRWIESPQGQKIDGEEVRSTV